MATLYCSIIHKTVLQRTWPCLKCNMHSSSAFVIKTDWWIPLAVSFHLPYHQTLNNHCHNLSHPDHTITSYDNITWQHHMIHHMAMLIVFKIIIHKCGKQGVIREKYDVSNQERDSVYFNCTVRNKNNNTVIINWLWSYITI